MTFGQTMSSSFSNLTNLTVMMGVLFCVGSCNDEEAVEKELCGKSCNQSERCETESFYSDYESVDECIEYCMDEDGFDRCIDKNLTAECIDLRIELDKCVVSLSCGEYYSYWDELIENYPCKYEVDKYYGKCEDELDKAENACIDSGDETTFQGDAASSGEAHDGNDSQTSDLSSDSSDAGYP